MEERGEETDVTTFLKKSLTPYVITDNDMTRLSADESQRIWTQRSKGTTTTTATTATTAVPVPPPPPASPVTVQDDILSLFDASMFDMQEEKGNVIEVVLNTPPPPSVPVESPSSSSTTSASSCALEKSLSSIDTTLKRLTTGIEKWAEATKELTAAVKDLKRRASPDHRPLTENCQRKRYYRDDRRH